MTEVNIEFIGQINPENTEKLIQTIREKVPDNCERIHLAIQSLGGAVPVALALANMLKSLKCEIKTYNVGNVDSAAIIVFSAGTDRVCSAHATFGVHPVAKILNGEYTAESLTQILNEIEIDTEKVAECISQNIKSTTPSAWKTIMSTYHTLNAKEAIDIGLVHKIEDYNLLFGNSIGQ